MRRIYVLVLVVVGISAEAAASPRGGGSSGGGGGGRLALVSAGIGKATGASSGARGTQAQARSWAVPCDEGYRRRVYDGLCVRRCPEGTLLRTVDGVCVRRPVALVLAPGAMLEAEGQSTSPKPQSGARVSAYFGAQKVFESDGAFSLELAVADRWLRLEAGLTRFYEGQQSGDPLTLTMPSLALGVRIDDSTTTRVYVEAGVVGAITKHDPMMMDSSITGAVGGVVAEHSLSKHTSVVGAAKLMAFQDDVRAASLRAGLRYRHVQASFSVLDFNVGPALFGPELGVGF